MSHWLKSECRELFVTAVKSVLSKFVPSALVCLPLIYSFTFRSMYVSLRQIWETPNRSGPQMLWAYRLPRPSLGQTTVRAWGKISNCELTDTVCADMAGQWLVSVGRRCLFLCVSVFLLAFCLTIILSRLPTRPRNLPIKCCVHTVTCIETISRGFTSGDLFPAMSVRILPPVRNVSRRRVLAPLQRIGLTTRHKPHKELPIPQPAEGRVELRRPVR